jgi:hypothetical protein
MEDSVLVKPHPRLEVHLKSRKLIADGKEAIDAVRWPIRIAIVLVALCPVIVVCQARPASWIETALTYVRSLL